MIRNNKQGFGNDEYTKILITAEETINAIPDPNEFTESSYGGNSGSSHTCYLGGTNIPTQSASKQKFGSNSIAYPLIATYTSYIEVGSALHGDWTLLDDNYTIDCWFYVDHTGVHPGTTTKIFTSFGMYEDNNNYNFCEVYHTGVPGIYDLQYNIVEGGTSKVALSTPVTSYLNTWVHLAIIRNGSTFSLYIDGVFKDSDTYGSSLRTVNSVFYCGVLRESVTAEFGTLYIDEFRLSKGIARWTRDFIVPNRAY